jgi:hypothetical protein
MPSTKTSCKPERLGWHGQRPAIAWKTTGYKSDLAVTGGARPQTEVLSPEGTSDSSPGRKPWAGLALPRMARLPGLTPWATICRLFEASSPTGYALEMGVSGRARPKAEVLSPEGTSDSSPGRKPWAGLALHRVAWHPGLTPWATICRLFEASSPTGYAQVILSGGSQSH